MILIDREIRTLCRSDGLLDPFSESVQGDNVISYGLTHAGYDLRLGGSLLVFKNSWAAAVDPKQFKEDDEGDYRRHVFEEVKPVNGFFVLPAHSYALGYSVERFNMPRWLKAHCLGKSTYARTGVLINTTPVEPGWCGHLTLEISNISPCPCYLYSGEGIAQVEFHRLTGEPVTDYAAKGGKYQSQGAEPVAPKVL